MNLYMFNAINGLANHYPFIDNAMIYISKYGPFIFLFSLIGFYLSGIFAKNKTVRGITVDTAFMTVLCLVVSYIIGIFYYESRPFTDHAVNLLYNHDSSASFPSDHSLFTMCIALGLCNYKRLSANWLYVLAVLIGFSRVYVGHHYPMDVIGSWIIAIVFNYGYSKIINKKIQNIYFKAERIFLQIMKFSLN